jgi:osmotically-inducible protein OsmY
MVSNGKLYTAVMEKLNFDPRIDASNITVAIKGNHDIVVLDGTVKTFVEKAIAENIIKTIPGIHGIVDEIKVDSTLAYKTTDNQIIEEVARALKSNVLIPAESIKVVVDTGYVTLSGEVAWQFQKQEALWSIRSIAGVKSVINNIAIKPSVNIEPSRVKEQITREFERRARLDANNIQVKVEGRKIILSGAVSNLDEMDEAIDVAWSIPGVEEVTNDLIK